MFFFSDRPALHPLTIGLKKMPAAPTLAEFKDLLRELFIEIYQQAPGFFEKKQTEAPPSFMSKLARAFEYDPATKKPPKVKNEALNGSIRTIRHMIYSHDAIKDTIDKDQKKITIPRLARLQILLAKRLSTLRIIKDQREHILSQDLDQIENLLILEDTALKKQISEGIAKLSTPANTRTNKLPRSEQALWQRKARPIYRLKLAHGLSIEIDERAFRPEDPDLAEKSLSRYLEIMFQIDPDSKVSKDIIAKIIKASPQY